MALVPNLGGADPFTDTFVFEFKDERPIPIGTLSANPIVLAKWKITRDLLNAINTEMYYMDLVATAELQKVSGGSSARSRFQSSLDDISYSSVITLTSGGTGSYFASKADVSDTFAFSDHVFFRIVLENGAIDTVGLVRNLKYYVEFLLPIAYTLERLI